MTIEEQLKKYICARYRSIREFTIAINMPYTTLDSLFRRGINNSSVATVVKICNGLGISLEELVDGKIIPVIQKAPTQLGNLREIRDHLDCFKEELASINEPTLDGMLVGPEIILAITQGIDVAYETVNRYNAILHPNHKI